MSLSVLTMHPTKTKKYKTEQPKLISGGIKGTELKGTNSITSKYRYLL